MRAAASLLHHRRLESQVWLDMPVGLTPSRVTPAGPERAIVFTRDPGRGRPEARAEGTQPGWLVLLGIRNHGPAPVRSADFSVPLAFTFPGRQVLAAWACTAPAAEREHGPASRSAVRVPEGGAAPGRGNPGLVLLSGDFLLRPKDACTIAVILSGTPVAGSRPVRRDGTLARGRITSRSDL